MQTIGSFSGVRLFEVTDPSRYGDLPADVQVPAAFRAEFNAWSARFFPADPALNPLKDGEVILQQGGQVVYANPRTVRELRAAVKNLA